MSVALAALRGPSRAARWRRRRLRRLAAAGLLALGALTLATHSAPPAAPATVTTKSDPVPSRAVVPHGQSEIVVPVDDPHIAAILHPGDRVDLYDGSSTTPVASDLLVVSSLTNAESNTATGNPALLVAAPDPQIGGITRSIGLAAGAGTTLRVAIGSRH